MTPTTPRTRCLLAVSPRRVIARTVPRPRATSLDARPAVRLSHATMAKKTTLSAKVQSEIVSALRTRFEKNKQRHKGLDWSVVEAKLAKNADALWSLHEMDATGGEPDVIAYDKKSGELLFVDCSEQSPKGRRSVCFDRAALDSRKEHKPKTSAMEMAAAMGVELLSEAEYRELQKVGEFDTTTSSWVQTPASVRKLGGALFCDRRYDTVFVYHNGAESYYAARGWRGALRVR
jgi:hypothetical protein